MYEKIFFEKMWETFTGWRFHFGGLGLESAPGSPSIHYWVDNFKYDPDTDGTYGGNNGSTDDLPVCSSRNSHPGIVLKNSFSQIFRKISEKHLRWSLFWVKFQG